MIKIFKLRFLGVFCSVLSVWFCISPAVNAELQVDIAVSENDSAGTKNKSTLKDSKSEHKSDIMRFANKDRLHGKMLSFISGEGLYWKSDESKNKILFKTDNITEIELGQTSAGLGSFNMRAMLTNGDTLAGTLVKLGAKQLLLDTEYAGRINIDRHMISALYPSGESAGNTYHGPNSTDEWIISSNNRKSNVTVADNILKISGYSAAGREMHLPDKSKIEFTLSDTVNNQFMVNFYGAKVTRNPRSGYILYISSGYIYLQRCNNGGSNNMGNLRSRQLQGGKGKITILTDTKQKKIALLLNDMLLKQWTDTSWAGQGGCLTFLCQGNNPLKISAISVGKWNGRIPGEKGSKSEGNKDTIEFINDDIVSGTLKTIENGKVQFATEYAEMNIPIKRIKEITTSSDTQHRARRRSGDIQCIFDEGDSVTLKVKQIKDDVIEGETENFGKVKMKLGAFRKLKFNIYHNGEDDAGI